STLSDYLIIAPRVTLDPDIARPAHIDGATLVFLSLIYVIRFLIRFFLQPLLDNPAIAFPQDTAVFFFSQALHPVFVQDRDMLLSDAKMGGDLLECHASSR